MAGVGRERIELAKKRLQNVLRSHTVATARTLENKISDAGPTNQRIDPHILTSARNELETLGVIKTYRESQNSPPWYFLTGTEEEILKARLAELGEVYRETLDKNFTLRMGQSLEIAVSRALQGQQNFESVGHYRDLDKHDDSTLYSKEEPPSIVNERVCKGRLDFLLFTKDAGTVGVEVKNIREWFYSDRVEVLELLDKCCSLDAVPVLIARRYAYGAYSVLTDCGVLLHQTYNQIYAQADATLAGKVKDKRLLGYHDVRVGNEPDARLLKFIHVNLPILLPEARKKFDEKRELIQQYAAEEISHAEFVARLRGRDFEQQEPEFDPGSDAY
jgi:hypothetical protein